MDIPSTVAGDRFASVATELRADSEVADAPRGSFSWEPVGAAPRATRVRVHAPPRSSRLPTVFFARRSAEVSETKKITLHATSPKQWHLMPPSRRPRSWHPGLGSDKFMRRRPLLLLFVASSAAAESTTRAEDYQNLSEPTSTSTTDEIRDYEQGEPS